MKTRPVSPRELARRSHVVRILIVSASLFGLARASSAAGLPDDARLASTRAELQTLVDAAERAGLPVELLVDKIREGLAKGVPPQRITFAVRSLDESLKGAQREAAPHLPGKPPAPVLKAIVDAHALGCKPADLEVVLKAAAPKGLPVATRAVEVLAELAQRGYPTAQAAHTVAEIAARRAQALAELPARADTLTSRDGASRGEALDALARAGAQGLGLDHAEQLLHRAERGAQDDDHGPDRETSGPRGPKGNGADKDHGKKN